MEPSLRNIYHNDSLRGLKIATSPTISVIPTVLVWADDVTVVCRNHKHDIDAIFTDYEKLHC